MNITNFAGGDYCGWIEIKQIHSVCLPVCFHFLSCEIVKSFLFLIVTGLFLWGLSLFSFIKVESLHHQLAATLVKSKKKGDLEWSTL